MVQRMKSTSPVAFLFSLEEFFYQAYKSLLFLPPCVGLVDLLASFRNGQSLHGMGSDKFDLPCQFICVSRLEKEKGICIEIILNTRSAWSNHRLAARQVLENARGRVDMGKCIVTVRDEAHVASVNRVNNLLQRLLSEMKYVSL